MFLTLPLTLCPQPPTTCFFPSLFLATYPFVFVPTFCIDTPCTFIPVSTCIIYLQCLSICVSTPPTPPHFPLTSPHLPPQLPPMQFPGRCGQCVLVHGTEAGASGAKVLVKIIDMCPGCSYGDIDFSTKGLLDITGFSWDRKGISWEWVPDCNVPAPPVPVPVPVPVPTKTQTKPAKISRKKRRERKRRRKAKLQKEKKSAERKDTKKKKKNSRPRGRKN